jgi:nitrate reductase gamma subunit
MNALDTLLLVVFPYVAVVVLVLGTLYRRSRRGFTVTSLSSQFLEGRTLFWGSVPFHLGLLVLFFGHLLALLIPRALLAWNGEPLRLLILVELLLFTQLVLGIWIALGYRWGSSWAAADLAPYIRSLVMLAPETNAVFAMPWVIKLHVVGGFAILFMIPFSRLAHLVVAPLDYLVRPYQQVIWNWNPRTIRDPRTSWNPARPGPRELVLDGRSPGARTANATRLPPRAVDQLRRAATGDEKAGKAEKALAGRHDHEP